MVEDPHKLIHDIPNFTPREFQELGGNLEYTITVDQFLKVLNMQNEVVEQSKKITTPQLWLLGARDKIVDNDATRVIYNELKNARHRKCYEIDEGDHYMINWMHTIEPI